ncbi:MAG: metalloregulator ArsR/SmtB family transcription factor [Firmicutes bacterium]|nr:metalloregulator ArsR/SmtB family transcription factor [Bacillota bacterium]
MKNAVKIFKALSDRNRLRIIKVLQEHNGSCVCEICHILGISQSTTSRHLQVLEEAELIYSAREGKWANYYLTGSSPDSETSVKQQEQILNLIARWMEDGEQQVEDDRSKIKSCNRENLCSGLPDKKVC